MGQHQRIAKVGVLQKRGTSAFSSIAVIHTIPSRFINSRIPIPVRWCCCYHSYCTLATGSRDVPTLQAPTGVPAGLGQLAGASTLYLLHNIHICAYHPMSVCLQLAVADWSYSCVSGMGRANNLSPEMAGDRSLCSDVCEHPELVSEDSVSGSAAGDRLCPGILHAVI